MRLPIGRLKFYYCIQLHILLALDEFATTDRTSIFGEISPAHENHNPRVDNQIDNVTTIRTDLFSKVSYAQKAYQVIMDCYHGSD